jgi:hypothetical protein
MGELGIGIGVTTAEMDEPNRTGTLSPYDFAYWASTFVARGTPSDYADVGDETDGLSLVVWAASRIGVSFPSTLAAAVATLTPIEIDQALKTRGALLIGSAKICVTLGLDDVVDIVNGRYFVSRMTAYKRQDWIAGALLPGAKY